jgi:hypothetical protein
MEPVKWLRKYWFVIAAVIVLLALLFPKYCGYSYGGFVTTGATLHREDCTCLGLKYGTNDGMFGLGQCADCGTTYFCAGIPAGKSCFESVGVVGTVERTEKQIECG